MNICAEKPAHRKSAKRHSNSMTDMNEFDLISIICLFAFGSCNSPATQKSHFNLNDSTSTDQGTNQKPTDSFKLWYSFAGLGSGYGTMQPTFKVTGTDYVYTLEQNSTFTGKYDKKPEFICKGTLRASSIDSILILVKDIKDTLVYKVNPGIMSGGIHSISVKNEKTDVTFRLHNASDPTAQKIVDILNSNIPVDKQRLWLFDFPDEK
jgi:hypothetical protein